MGAQVLSAGPLERRADRRGTRVHLRAGGRGVAGRGAASGATAKVCSSTRPALRRISVPRRAARRNSTIAATLTLLGRTLARMHAVGSRGAFRASPGARRSSGSAYARAIRGARQRLRTRGARGTVRARQRTGDRTSPTVLRELRNAAARCASTAIATPATSCGARTARCSWTWTTACRVRASRTCGCSCPAMPRASRRPGRRSWKVTSCLASSTTRSSRWSKRCVRCASCITRRGSRHRWHDPAFPRAFPWFADARFWERHIADLFEQLAAMDDPPILSR